MFVLYRFPSIQLSVFCRNPYEESRLNLLSSSTDNHTVLVIKTAASISLNEFCTFFNKTFQDPYGYFCCTYKFFLFPVPRSIIQVRNISSTSLLVEWQDRWSQELSEFQIIYNVTTNEAPQNITVNASQQSVELHGLKFFTWYCVRVLVTRHGMQQASPCVYARTEQDGE